MTGAARIFSAFDKWTDEYLVSQYGYTYVGLEPKKEHRKMKKSAVTLQQYISFYTTRNVYSVTQLHPDMRYAHLM